MSILRKITIKGYKSIQNLENFKLSNLNILLGANGAGKSNFISVFKLLANMYAQELQLYVQKNGGIDTFLHYGRKKTKRINIELFFDSSQYHPYPCEYKVSLIPTIDNRVILEKEEITSDRYEDTIILEGYSEISRTKYPRFIKSNIDGLRVYHFQDTSDTALVKKPCLSNDWLRLKPDAENLAVYLIYLKDWHFESYMQIIKTIQLVAPFFAGFVDRKLPTTGNEQDIQLEWFEKGNLDTPFKAHILSDGTLRFMCLATLLLQPFELMNDTVLIDEPELGLHPYALAVLADLIKRAAEQKQLIISTQSVELINHFSANDIIVVDRVNDASTFKRLDEEQLKDWLEDYTLGDLWKQNVIGGRPSR